MSSSNQWQDWKDVNAIEPSRVVMTRERLKHFKALRVFKRRTFNHEEMVRHGYQWVNVKLMDTEAVRTWCRSNLRNKSYVNARYGTRYYFAYPEDLLLFSLRWV